MVVETNLFSIYSDSQLKLLKLILVGHGVCTLRSRTASVLSGVCGVLTTVSEWLAAANTLPQSSSDVVLIVQVDSIRSMLCRTFEMEIEKFRLRTGLSCALGLHFGSDGSSLEPLRIVRWCRTALAMKHRVLKFVNKYQTLKNFVIM